MNDLVYKNYLFSTQEFMVLSAFAGVGKLHLLLEGGQKEPDGQELSRIIFRLYQRGILCWKDEDSYELKQEIRLLFRDMNAAGRELQVYSKRSTSPLLCFWNDYTVVMELSGNDRDTVKVHSLPRNEFLEELQDRGILPEDNSGELADIVREENDRLWETFLKNSCRFVERGHIRYAGLKRLLAEREELSAFITVCDRKTNQGQSVILLLNYGMLDYIVCVKDDAVWADYYTQDNLKGFLTV